MATKSTTQLVAMAPAADAVAEATPAAAAPVTEPATAPTPENTPVPGGGSWRWDETAPGWVAADVPA